MGIGQKLDKILKDKGRNVNELATEIGVAPMTLYSIIKRDNSKMDFDLLIELAKALEVPVEYFSSKPLASNINSELTIEEKFILKKYRQLSADDKKRVEIFIDGIISLYQEEDDLAKKGGLNSAV